MCLRRLINLYEFERRVYLSLALIQQTHNVFFFSKLINLKFASVIIFRPIVILAFSSAPQLESAQPILKPLELRLHL